MTFVSHFNQIVNTLSDKLRSKADGKTVISMFDEINRATLDAIALVSMRMPVVNVLTSCSIFVTYMILRSLSACTQMQ